MFNSTLYYTGLLDSDSDEDEEDFAKLRTAREIQPNIPQTSNNSSDVDLLNMGGGQPEETNSNNVNSDIGLLNLNDDSNVDLLGGTTNAQTNSDTIPVNSNSAKTSDTFDLFADFDAAPPPTQDSTTSQSSGTFDPFADFNSKSSKPPSNSFLPFGEKSSNQPQQPQQSTFDPFNDLGSAGGNVPQTKKTFDPFADSAPTGDTEDDFIKMMEGSEPVKSSSRDSEPNLMGDWGAPSINLQATSNIPRNNSNSNLPRSGSASNFAGGNIPRNNSGNFMGGMQSQGMGGMQSQGGFGSANNLGGPQPMNPQQGGFGSANNVSAQQSQKMDPFADFGRLNFVFKLRRLWCCDFNHGIYFIKLFMYIFIFCIAFGFLRFPK